MGQCMLYNTIYTCSSYYHSKFNDCINIFGIFKRVLPTLADGMGGDLITDVPLCIHFSQGEFTLSRCGIHNCNGKLTIDL